jgi:hypothetical protein
MKLTDYEHLESLATKRGAITVQAADLLAWREELERMRIELADHEALNTNCDQYHAEVEKLRQVKLWGREVYRLLLFYECFTDLAELREDAPDAVRGEQP